MTARPEPAQPFFLPARAHSLFALYHPPAPSERRAAVLYVPPFAEEMHKSRRMAALQARALAAAGVAVLQFDLYGCGDSAGDFAAATWAGWLDDITAARAWLAERSACEPWLWGLRLGALLAGASLAQAPAPGFVLWQPVLSGRQHLQQFLRLKAGSEWVGGGGRSDAPKPIDELNAGHSVEIAGYELAPALALPMAEAELRLPGASTSTAWFEVSPRSDATLAPASVRLIGGAAGPVRSAVVGGPNFWAAQEIATAPALIAATTAVFTS